MCTAMFHMRNLNVLLVIHRILSFSEEVLMDESVRRYEPKQALFAEQEGLAIYEKIANRLEEFLTDSSKRDSHRRQLDDADRIVGISKNQQFYQRSLSRLLTEISNSL